jgi:phosphatidylserine decarboxylase
MTIHKEGFKILGGTLLLSTVLVGGAFLIFESPLGWILTAIACGIIFLLFLQFFRLPFRQNRASENELVAPCDGKVVVIEEVEEPEYFKGKRIQVSIFMSPLNVHANYYPVNGVVNYQKYHPGKFLVAWHPKSSTENERSTVVVKNAKVTILLRQIAGALARRIVTYSQKGDVVNQNEELGFIKFGSRVDMFLPIGTKVDVKIGDVVQGGVSRIATI